MKALNSFSFPIPTFATGGPGVNAWEPMMIWFDGFSNGRHADWLNALAQFPDSKWPRAEEINLCPYYHYDDYFVLLNPI